MTFYGLILGALLPLLVLFSAFFSGSETALFSLSRARLLSWRQATDKPRRAVIDLMSSYHYTLIVLILGNMFVNVGISMVEDELIRSLAVNRILSELISVFLAVFLLLIFGEITPKAIALTHTEAVALRVARPVWLLRRLLMPFVRFINACFSRILDWLGRCRSEPLSPEEYTAFLSASCCGEAFSPAERELLESALRINVKKVIDVMTGRIDILTINREDDAAAVAAAARRHR
ncbi:MAG: CNNM domain-containing protein, partial [Victivallales bacterium]|nr:CNNM domain-containing protein [Victivallales bacterium]